MLSDLRKSSAFLAFRLAAFCETPDWPGHDLRAATRYRLYAGLPNLA
jgi:hypothetical protein